MTNKICTLDEVRERNKVFFSKGTVSFHKDMGYKIVQRGEKNYLRVRFLRLGKTEYAYYRIGDDLRLQYTHLIEDIM